jgi:hypothetical protein
LHLRRQALTASVIRKGGADVTSVRCAAILLSTQHRHTLISISGASGGVAVPNEGVHHQNGMPLLDYSPETPLTSRTDLVGFQLRCRLAGNNRNGSGLRQVHASPTACPGG